MSLTLKLLIGVAAGMVVGTAIHLSKIDALIDATYWLLPIGMLWTNALAMTVIPMVMAGSIASIGGLQGTTGVGRALLLAVLVFALLLTLAAVVTVVVSVPLLSMVSVAGWTGPTSFQRLSGLGTALSGALPFDKWLAALVPTNPVRAAVESSLAPVVLFSVALGAAVSTLAPKSKETFLRFFSGSADTLGELARLILRFGPIAVFVLTLQLGGRLGSTAAGAAAVYGLMVAVACVLAGLLCYPMVRVFAGIPMGQFARACARVQVVGGSTRTSVAALPAMLDAAERDLGIRPSVARSVAPFAAGLFSIGTVVTQTAAVLALCHLYKIELGVAGVASLILASAYMSLNIPRTAGGAAIAMIPVLVAYKVPLEGVGIVLMLDVIADVLVNAVNVTGQLAGTCVVARHVGAVSTSQAAAPA